jgi:hypothetical protein
MRRADRYRKSQEEKKGWGWSSVTVVVVPWPGKEVPGSHHCLPLGETRRDQIRKAAGSGMPEPSRPPTPRGALCCTTMEPG